MRIIELFAGIGACSKALKNIGIDVEIVDAVEIDKYAVKSFNAIHGTNFDVQDIMKWDKYYEDIDMITHGSPCQDFSVAGKQAGGDIGSGTRSSLMYETIRIVGKIRPKYVLWENVKNLLSKSHKHNFDAYINTMNALGYNSYYQVLNAKDYGVPQNRERVFTISIRKDVDKGYTFDKGQECNNEVINPLKNKTKYSWQFEQAVYDENGLSRALKAGGGSGNIPKVIQGFKFPEKEELKLKLKDILEEEVDEKYYLKDYQIENIKKSNFCTNKRRIQEKDYCDTLCARDWKDPKCVQVANLKGGKWDKINESCRRIYDENGLAPTVHTCQGGNTEPKIIEISGINKINIPQVVKVRKYPVDTEKLKTVLRDAKVDSDVSNEQLEMALDVPITTVEHWFRRDNSFSIPNPKIWFELKRLLKIETDEFDESIMTFEEREGVFEKSNRCYFDDGIAPNLTQQQEKVITNLRIRKLTPKECWRLMGFDDEDFEKAQSVPTSNAQLYKQARKFNCG